MKGPPFYYQYFPDPEFATSLSFECSRHINKCKYLISVRKYQQLKRFLTNFTKNWKDRYFKVNVHRSFKLSDNLIFLWQLSQIGPLLLKLVLEIWTLVRFSSTLNKGDLFKNQQNEMTGSRALNSKKGGLLYFRFSDLKNLCLYFLLMKQSEFEQFSFFKKTSP